MTTSGNSVTPSGKWMSRHCAVRVIGRLDVKGSAVIKGFQMEGLRVVGDPRAMARELYAAGADELLYVDTVASLYDRDSICEILSATVRDVFVPLTVVGGVRSVEDARRLLRAGADKVGINTAALARPSLLREVSETFGSQATVLSVEAKRGRGTHRWLAYTNGGRDDSGRGVLDWIEEALDQGVGEVLVTSVDRDGTRHGLDAELVKAVGLITTVPLVVSGGAAVAPDVAAVVEASPVDGVAVGTALHRGLTSIDDLKSALESVGCPVRRDL